MSHKTKIIFFISIILLPLIVVFSFSDPIYQSIEYLNFVDKRSYFRVPNFGDVISNIGFSVVGAMGMSFQMKRVLSPIIFGLFFS